MEVDVSATRLDDAVRVLGRQSGASIGFHDARLAGLQVQPVRGRLTTEKALKRMLRDTPLQVRRVAPATWLIEPKPKRARPVTIAAAPEPVARVPSSYAETAPPRQIVVTGTKRDVPLGAYPGGVQIIDGDSLSTAEARHGSDAIETRVASVVSTHLGQGRNKLFIRGIADSSFVGPTQATVGQYWGNSRITYSAPDPSLRLYDVGTIEVLEGPQGTLYGAGSLGGVVRVVPRAPDLDETGGGAWGGVQAVQHGKPGVDGGGVLNLPLVEDQLGIRAVAFGSIEGGYIDDRGRKLNNVNDVRTIGGRMALRFQSDSELTIDANMLGQRIDGDDSQYADRTDGKLSRSSSIAQPYRNDFWLADLVIRKEWDELELTSSLGYARQYVFERFEGPVLTNPQDSVQAPLMDAPSAAFSQANHIEMITAETRLARRGRNGTGWLIGVSLLRNEARVNRLMETTPAGIPLVGMRNRVEEATLYGEASFEPLDHFVVTFGGRLTHSRLTGNSEDAVATIAYSRDPGARAARSETRLLPSAALAWRPDDSVTLYARYQQGFRPGGIAVSREYIRRFKGDRVETVEVGGRYRSPDFDIEATASWTRWQDIQADLIDSFGFPTTANIGDGRILSVGVSARWRPLEGLEFDAALYANKSKVTQPSPLAVSIAKALDPGTQVGYEAVVAGVPGTGLDLGAGAAPADWKRLPNIADLTGRVGFSYNAPLTQRYDIDVKGFARYIGKSTLGIGPILGQLQGDYVDTGLEVRVGNKGQGVTLSLTNLFDTRGNRFALGSPFLVRDRDQITPLQPRTIRLGFDAAF